MEQYISTVYQVRQNGIWGAAASNHTEDVDAAVAELTQAGYIILSIDRQYATEEVIFPETNTGYRTYSTRITYELNGEQE